MTLYVCENDAKVHSYNHLRGVYTIKCTFDIFVYLEK